MEKQFFNFILLLLISISVNAQSVTLTPNGSSHNYESNNKQTILNSGGTPLELKTSSTGYLTLPFYNNGNSYQGQLFAGFGIFGLNGGAINAVSFWTGNGEKARLTTNGNFGIGITSPQHKLDVNGDIRSSALAGSGNRPVFADTNGILVTDPQIEINLSNTNILPSNNSFSYVCNGTEVFINNSMSSSDRFFIPINLPTGATIDSVNYYVSDLADDKNLKISLVAERRTGAGSTSFPYYTSGSLGYQELKRPIQYMANEERHLYLEIRAVDNLGNASTWINSSLKFRMATIIYSYH
ncbi:hypothetical protein [Jiulongibacter sediminis]|jgi:hypothetical protein|uniref:hypothetical protein n=1 Tax=Jiulongibacter sediminis TaxID=1605367 RepID=UPI0026EEB0C6|nr:hypothetical protein [Jiulongibacter sediminis]